MAALLPRIRGKAEKVEKGWTFVLVVTIGPDDGTNDLYFGPKENVFYLSREAALAALGESVTGITKKICESMGLPEPAGVMNMKAGKMQTFNEFKDEVTK